MVGVNEASSDQPRLSMRGVRKAFGATVALDGVDLAVHAGSVHALVGENGAGKSTLMKILSGAHSPDAGQMWLDGRPFRPRNPLDARRAGVAMIYQELSLAPHLTVKQNITLGMEPARFGVIHRRSARAQAIEALDQLGHTDINPAAVVGRLSVGSQQLVEIARALAFGARVLVLDEPTSSLTQPDAQRLFSLVERLRDRGLAIVYISHFLEEVKQVAGSFTVLRDGRSVGEGDTAATSVDRLVAMMVGRQIDDLYPRSDRQAGDVVLELDDLTGVWRPRSASLQLYRGEVLGIAGLVGAGRTEMLRAVFGLDPVRDGAVRVGAYVGPASPTQRWRQGVGLLSEDRKREGLAVGLSVADNVTLSRLESVGSWGFVHPARQRRATQRWIERLGIRCRGATQPVADLSGGNQQKVALARLLHHDVDVLLLDEPTRGIDVASKAQIYQIIDDLAASGKAILMVSSYLPELLGISDRIAVMCRGELGEARPVGQWDEHKLMLEATGTDEPEGEPS